MTAAPELPDPAADDSPAEILLLGDPRLREVARPVEDFADPAFAAGCRRLQATLAAFRRAHGFGRAIAAPQIGLPWRLVAADLGGRRLLLANPEITWASPERITMWDDCMSFPPLLVRLSRHRSISLTFRDERGEPRSWERLATAESELFQHEIDHLDGILAIDRAMGHALDREAIVLRAAFVASPEHFLRQVDYTIGS